MKRFNIKRITAPVLVLAMVVGTAGCGKKNEGGGSSASGNKALAKENIYTFETLSDGLGGGSSSGCDIRSLTWDGDKLRAIATITEYTEASKQELLIREWDLQGNNLAERRIDLSGGVGDAPASEDQISGKWLGGLALAEDGSILGQVEESTTIHPDTENAEYISSSKIYCWGSDDSLAWTKDMDMFVDNPDGFYISGIYKAEGNGWYVLGGQGEELSVYRVTLDGQVEDTKPLKKPEGMESLNMAYPREDGKLLLVGYASDWIQQVIATFDPATGQVGELTGDGGMLYKYNIIGYDGEDSFVLATNSGIFTGKLGQEAVPVMDFVNSDFGYSWISAAVRISDSQFVGTYTDDQGVTQVALFTYVPPENVADKQVLTLGANYIGGDLRSRIIQFNKANTKYRITIKDYSTYNTEEDYEAGTKQLANDIVAGKMPDILVADTTIPVEEYAAKGLLASVDDYISRDEELSKTEFMDNVFEAYRIKGKLYQVIPYFTVGTVVAKESIAKGHENWTMDEMLETVKSMGEGVTAFDNVTRDSFFDLVMRYSGADFVDVSSGKCDFNTPAFIQLLEFAATLPESEDWSAEEFDWIEFENRFRNNKVLLDAITLNSVRGINRIEQANFGEKATFVGFPSSNGRGSVINMEEAYLISSKSKNGEGAWEFLRFYLLEDYQGKVEYGMPVRRDAFLSRAKEATQKPYYMDEKGQKVEYDESIYIQEQEITIAPMTQERVDEVVAFIEGIRHAGYSNRAVLDIINEEAAGFFENQKSAQDVAAVIQSRVQIYVDERR